MDMTPGKKGRRYVNAKKDLAGKRDNFQNLDVDGRIVLKWLVKGWNSEN